MSVELKADCLENHLRFPSLCRERMLVFPWLPGSDVVVKSAQAGVDSVWPIPAAATTLIRLLAKMCIVWGPLSLMGLRRNFITFLKTELTPHSFRPIVEGRFAKQTSGVDKMRKSA